MKGIITIDGPAGAGKSTVSRLVAKKLGYVYLDTGAMYRAVAYEAKRKGIDFNAGLDLLEMCRDLDLKLVSDGGGHKVFIGDKDISSEIREPEMDMLSSKVSAVKEVREAMTVLQRKTANSGGVVAEGRDMGTVVFPDADHKFYITASPEVRAERRYAERKARGESVSRENVERELKKRDKQDENRLIAPLRPAEDAILIDTSGLDIDEVVNNILVKL